MSLIADSSYSFFVDGVMGNASPSSSTVFSYTVPQTMALFGFTLIQNGGEFGDYISIAVVDVNNVLGYGANFLVAKPVNKAYIDPDTTLVRFISDYAKTIPSGLVVQITYTNTSLLGTVDIAANFHFMIGA